MTVMDPGGWGGVCEDGSFNLFKWEEGGCGCYHKRGRVVWEQGWGTGGSELPSPCTLNSRFPPYYYFPPLCAFFIAKSSAML